MFYGQMNMGNTGQTEFQHFFFLDFFKMKISDFRHYYAIILLRKGDIVCNMSQTYFLIESF